MRILSAMLAGLCCILSLSAQESQPTAAPDIAGAWEGAINAGGAKLRVVVKVKKDGDQLSATFDSIDQGVKDIKLDDVKFVDSKFSFKLREAYASYSGTMAKDGRTIDGKWSQGGAVDLTLKHVDKPSEIARPQTPKPPFPYDAVDVTYGYEPKKPLAETFQIGGDKKDKSRILLAGTLTTPKGDGPFPAAILITGSGAQDRDETLFAHKPFWVIADRLTRAGIAVLRVDDRSVGGSSGNFAKSTSADFSEDVLAGVEFLRRQKNVDPKKIGVIGHSEGGLVGPMAAAADPTIAFVCMLAGPGVDGGEVLKLQNAAIGRANGLSDAMIEKTTAINLAVYDIMRKEPDHAAMLKAVRKLLEDVAAKDDSLTGGNPKKFVDQVMNGISSPWMHYFIAFDPKTALAKVHCPLLALNGALDMQVDAAQNIGAIEKILTDAKHPDFTVKTLPGLNHLFQHAKTGATSEYATIEETFAPEALEFMTKWIAERFLKK